MQCPCGKMSCALGYSGRQSQKKNYVTPKLHPNQPKTRAVPWEEGGGGN